MAWGPVDAASAAASAVDRGVEGGAKPGIGAQLRSAFDGKIPRSPALSPGEADAAVARLAADDPCRAAIRDELLRGERPEPATDRCVAARDRVLARLARRQRASFGLVDRREEDLARISLLLSRARGCRRWLLGDPGRGAPVLGEALAAKCAVRRYRGPLAVVVVDAAGQRAPVFEIRPQSDGRYVVRYAEVDAALGHRGLPRLVAWDRLELGVGGWAGSVDLAAGRSEARDRHAKAVLTGRGVPALFVVRHPEHPAADDARLLAEESRLLRKQGDYEAVVDGTMSPRRFLARYVISRYHRAVREIERGVSPSEPAPPPPKEICPEGHDVDDAKDARDTTNKHRENAEAPAEGAAARGRDGCRTAATATPPADPRP
ncbi:MAG: hypothetical protein KC486_31180 [Myxococcales bacterium]|nr:hypothetical protein [Myxococcales bacterium]